MTNPTPHGQVPEALIDLIDAYAETRHRCGGIYNARTEAARKAVIEALSGVQALSAAPAVAAPAAPTPEHIAAMERAWLWMDNQADQQSKGGHATFDLMMLREERDALRAAIDAAPKATPVVWLSSKQLRGVTALHGQYLPFRCQPEGRFDTPVYLVEAAPKAAQEEMDKEASNARLDIDSNSTEPEQQRDVACSLEVGQHVGNGEHQEASCRGSKDSELLKIAARNLKYFIAHAQFSSFADKQAALNCIDILAAPQQEAQEPVIAYRISDPQEPTRGRWLSEFPGGPECVSEPLCLAKAASNTAGELLMGLAVIRELTGTQQKGLEDTIDAVRALLAARKAAPAPAILDELRDTLMAVSVAIAEQDDRAAQKMIREILAASSTPPAEQQAQPGAVYAELPQPDSWFHFTAQFWENKLRDFADRTHALRMQAAPKAAPTRTALPEGWTDCTIEFGNDGPEVVAYGPKRMMTRLAKWLGKYFAQVIAEAAPKAAPGAQNTVPAEWLEQAYREGWAACRDAETIGEEAEDWAFGNSTANSRMIDAQQAAPQQAVAGEPVANDIHGALTAAAIYLTNAQRQYGKDMHRQAIASLEKAKRAVAQAADFAKAAPRQEA